MKRLAFLTVLSLATAFLASGCLWGYVHDVKGGAGAVVRYQDQYGRVGEAVACEDGLYFFSLDPLPWLEANPPPAAGWVSFWVMNDPQGALNCPWQFFQRYVRYSESELWGYEDIQDFTIGCVWPYETPTPPPPGARPTPSPTSTPIALPWPFTPVSPPR